MLLLQVVWVFAVPPFGGLDEFDHTYRAASVSRGEWVPDPSSATRGTGAWLTVPRDIVEAARPECLALDYTGANDCVGTPRGDSVVVASGAGRYHPAYYALVGGAARPFDGVAALYAMRLTSTLVCWLFFVGAVWATTLWARTRWPVAGLVLSATPVLVYSSSIAAPNGLEMMAGIVLWTSLLGLATSPAAPEPAWEAATVDLESVILRRDCHLPGALVADGVVPTAVAKLELDRFRTD